MADLETLRPEVQAAMRELREALRVQGVGSHGPQFAIISAELRRLTDGNARLEQFARSCISAGGESVFRATKAEAELAALKARIAGAPVGVFGLCYNGHEPGFLGFPQAIDNLPRESMLGKRVRLVVEE